VKVLQKGLASGACVLEDSGELPGEGDVVEQDEQEGEQQRQDKIPVCYSSTRSDASVDVSVSLLAFVGSRGQSL